MNPVVRFKLLPLLMLVPALCQGADEPGRWVVRNNVRNYVLNPNVNAAFVDRAIDLAVARYYNEPLARAGISNDLRERVLAVLKDSHRRIQRVVLDDLWENAGKENAAERSSWKPAVKKEYAGQEAALKDLLGGDGYSRLIKSMADIQLERETSPERCPAADAEKIRGILRKHLLGGDGLPLKDQSAGLAAIEGDASSLSPEGREALLKRWNAKSFPLSVARPLVAIPGTKSSFDPALLK